MNPANSTVKYVKLLSIMHGRLVAAFSRTEGLSSLPYTRPRRLLGGNGGPFPDDWEYSGFPEQQQLN